MIHINNCSCTYCSLRKGIKIKPPLNKRGVITLYITFIITAIMIVVIAAFLAPTGVRLNSALYIAGQEIIANAQPDIDAITDTAVKAQLNETLSVAQASAANNIQVNADIFTYSWILVLGLTALVVFLFTRRLTEINSGFV